MARNPQDGEAPDLPKMISIGTFAEMLEVSPRTVQRLVQRGKAPKPVHLGGNVRWRLDGVIQWIDEGCPPLIE